MKHLHARLVLKKLLTFNFKLLIPRRPGRGGFSIIELVLALALVIVIGTIGFVGLLGKRSRSELEGTAKQIAAVLRDAQARSVSQSSSTSWGAHLENSTTTAPFYALFATASYSTATRQSYYRLPSGIVYATSTLAAGTSVNITFTQITGTASASTTVRITLVNDPNTYFDIRVASSGAVGY